MRRARHGKTAECPGGTSLPNVSGTARSNAGRAGMLLVSIPISLGRDRHRSPLTMTGGQRDRPLDAGRLHCLLRRNFYRRVCVIGLIIAYDSPPLHISSAAITFYLLQQRRLPWTQTSQWKLQDKSHDINALECRSCNYWIICSWYTGR